jgi:hypothetical protein
MRFFLGLFGYDQYAADAVSAWCELPAATIVGVVLYLNVRSYLDEKEPADGGLGPAQPTSEAAAAQPTSEAAADQPTSEAAADQPPADSAAAATPTPAIDKESPLQTSDLHSDDSLLGAFFALFTKLLSLLGGS